MYSICFARLSHRLAPSVSVSVCPHYQNGASSDYEIFTVPATRTLSWQNFMRLGKEVTLERRRERGVPLKCAYFTAIGSIACKRLQIGKDMLLFVTSTSDELYKGVNIDDLERPWISIISCFSEFFAATHISRVNCTEMAGDRLRQPAHDIFSIKCRFYCCKFRLHRLKEGSARGRQRRGPFSRKWLFYRYWLACVKTLADKRRHAAYHNEH